MVKHELCLCILILNINLSFCRQYDNYALYRGIPVNNKHLEFFQNLTTKYDVNFWREPVILHKPVEFVISPTDRAAFDKDADEYGLYLTTILEDVQLAFDNQTVKSYIRRRTDSFDWMNYFRVNDIYNWMRDLARANPNAVKVKSIGKTSENRDIMAMSISLNDSSSSSKKVIIEGGIHAREWISISFVTYFINAIAHAPYSKDEELKTIAYMFDWHFVPVLNPDGYEHTHNQDRMWRKNRHKHGTDLNRNFGYHFGTKGISFEPKSETYCGRKAFSEPESAAMANFVKSQANNLAYYFAFHAYGQYMIVPYADLKRHTDNFEDVKLMGLLAAQRLKSRYGTKYSVGTAYDTVGYQTSGISGDWVKKHFKTPVVCTFELRDSGKYGFALPPDQILPTCEETLDAMMSFLTPREKGWQDHLKHEDLVLSDGQKKSFLNLVVIVCNVLLFIIVRFDYFEFYCLCHLLS